MIYFPGSCWRYISWSALWCLLARAVPSLPRAGQIQDRAASADIAESPGPVISRVKPALGSRRESHSSTELGLLPHGNSSGCPGPVISRGRPVLGSRGEDHPSTELGLLLHWNSSGFLGPVKSRERPVLVSCREDHSSSELGLPQHGNFSELQTPVAYWKGHRTGRARDFSS